MEIEKHGHKLRFLEGTPAELEAEVNLLLESYAPLERFWGVVDGRILGVIVMIHLSEIRKMQLAQALNSPRM